MSRLTDFFIKLTLVCFAALETRYTPAEGFLKQRRVVVKCLQPNKLGLNVTGCVVKNVTSDEDVQYGGPFVRFLLVLVSFLCFRGILGFPHISQKSNLSPRMLCCWRHGSRDQLSSSCCPFLPSPPHPCLIPFLLLFLHHLLPIRYFLPLPTQAQLCLEIKTLSVTKAPQKLSSIRHQTPFTFLEI